MTADGEMFDGDPVAGHAVKLPTFTVHSHERMLRGDVVVIVLRAEIIKAVLVPVFDDEWLLVWGAKTDIAAVVIRDGAGFNVVTDLLNAEAEDRRRAAEERAGIQRLPDPDDVIAVAEAEIETGLAALHADDEPDADDTVEMTDEEWEASNEA